MTEPHEEYGEILRRALHAEAETVVPAADGLDRIRARISERPVSRFGWSLGWSWFTASWARPAMAGAAALIMAAVVVSAQPAISSFTVGGHGAPEQGEHGEGGTSGDTQPGGREQPSEVPLRPGKGQATSPTKSRTRSPAFGGQGCGRPVGPGGSAVASATDTPPSEEPQPTCAQSTTTTSPSPADTSAPPISTPPVSSPPPESPPAGGEQPLSKVDP
jgi:hypothetical protein